MANSVYRKTFLLALACAAFAENAIGQTNQVLSVNGTSAYATIPNSSTLQPSNAITVEAWIYPKSVPSGDLGDNSWFISKSDGQTVTSQRTYEVAWTKNNSELGGGEGIEINLFLNTSTWAFLGTVLPESNWVHVAFTYSSANGLFQLFTNGVLVSSTTTDASGSIPLAGQFLRQTTLPLSIGGQTIIEGPLFAAGYMDEIRIWSTNLTGIQIAENRFCTLTGKEPNLTAYWNFDGTNANDLTSNGNNGALEGGAVIVPINGQDIVHDGVCGAPYFQPSSLSFSKTTGFHQKLYGPSGMTLEIETSTNLTNWSPLFILPNFSGELEFDDIEAVNLPQRFYKIMPQ